MKNARRTSTFLFTMCLFSVSAWFLVEPTKAQLSPTAIRGVTLIDGISDTPRENMTVIVADGHIAAIGKASSLDIPMEARVIEASDMYLMPGLWDMHAHLSYWGEDALEMLVRSGVTSIRELGGDPDEIGAWKSEIEAGERIGPKMIWCGPFIEGIDGPDEYRIKVSNTAEVVAAARLLHQRGVDFLKIQPQIDRDLVTVLIEEARSLGLTVVGHLPDGVTAVEGSTLGLRSIEHMSPYMSLNDDEIDRVIETYLENETWLSPALFSLIAPIEARGEDPMQDDRTLRALEIVGRAHRRGVPILAGSNFAYRDWPQQPGTGLHGELRSLVLAGLSEMEVIKLATVQAATFAGSADKTGSLQEGRQADMILLRANPLEDIGNIAKITFVMLDGEVVTPGVY